MNNTKRSIELSNDRDPCYGLFFDTNETLYCSILAKHRVIKRSLRIDNDSWITAAGDGIEGNPPTRLRFPQGIFVDINFTLYVADCDNNVIQQFKFNSTVGLEVPTNTGLHCPTDIVLDGDNNMYIVDNKKHRIIRATLPLNNIECLIGCSATSGIELNKLTHPIALMFDTMGNIYVTDTKNKRVLKFLLINTFGK